MILHSEGEDKKVFLPVPFAFVSVDSVNSEAGFLVWHLPLNLADDHVVLQIEHLLLVEASVVDWVVVAFSQNV